MSHEEKLKRIEELETELIELYKDVDATYILCSAKSSNEEEFGCNEGDEIYYRRSSEISLPIMYVVLENDQEFLELLIETIEDYRHMSKIVNLRLSNSNDEEA